MAIAAASAVNGVTNSANTQTKASGPATLEYDAFLKLLVAELQNQDPTEPMNSSEYVAQLASFSNVEQSVRINDKLDLLMTNLAFSQADGLIGKTVTSGDGSISGKVAALRVVSEGPLAILEDGGELLIGNGVKVSP
jgi:flagellar basal-body rod modification protein FlgD